MRDDALAPVIAIMLILAIIVTFFSLWNALVIPSMKQSSEVEHLQNVESAFQQFSSDIEKAVSLKQDGIVFSEPVQLGGGDVISDPVRSSGSLYVKNESRPVYNLILYDGSMNPRNSFDSTSVGISYEPVNNFWQDQGYTWQYGYINVTKYQQARQTPLGYDTMTDVANDLESGTLGSFAGSFGDISHGGTCSDIEITTVNLTASLNHPFASSNGYGKLQLVTSRNVTDYSGISSIQFSPEPAHFGHAAAVNWKKDLAILKGKCNNIDTGTIENDLWMYSNSSPIRVTYTTVTIVVSAN